MSIKKLTFILIITIALTLGLSISLQSLLAAWTAPTAIPPNDNTAAPINVSATGQAKQGGLILNTSASTNGLIVQYGNVGIGTTNPGAELEVNGNIIANAPIQNNHVATKGYVDAASIGGCYISYINDSTDGACLSGFTNMGSLGTYGSCVVGEFDRGAIAVFRPPGTNCEGGFTPQYIYTRGTAYLCCK